MGEVKDCRREIFVAFRCAGSGFPSVRKIIQIPTITR